MKITKAIIPMMLVLSLLSPLFIMQEPVKAATTITFVEHQIPETLGTGGFGLEVFDLDGDNDMDIIYSSYDNMSWLENDGSESFTFHEIDASLANVLYGGISCADLDDDTDIDIAVADDDAGDIVWLENDGSEGFTKNTINASYGGDNLAIATGDIDGDDDIDIAATHCGDSENASWFNNSGDADPSFTQHIYCVEGSNPLEGGIMINDTDSDGNMDILVGSSTYFYVFWNDGSESFSKDKLSNTAFIGQSVDVEDIDQDDDYDIVSSYYTGDNMGWFEQTSAQTFSLHQTDTDNSDAKDIALLWNQVNSEWDIVVPADGHNNLDYWENDGSESFTQTTINASMDCRPIEVGDLDDDGDDDIIVYGNFADIVWYENTGEANSPPTQSNENPEDAAIDQEIAFTWNVTIEDPEGDQFNWTIECSDSSSSNADDASNGSKELALSGLSYSTEYTIWVNCTDGNDNSGSWTNATYTFTTKAEPPWGEWSDGWSISDSHSCTGTGYLYGNWSEFEFVDSGTLDDLWTYANASHWDIVDNSAWWGGNHTLEANTSLFNSTFALFNDSGNNRSQTFGWIHSNDTEVDAIYPFVIFDYNTSQDFHCVMWTSMEAYILHWNGTNMTDLTTGDAVVIPNEDATDLSDQWIQEGVYLTDQGNYYKIIYNSHNGSLRFKWWDGANFLTEPTGWCIQTYHANLSNDRAGCHGIGIWNPYAREALVQFDMLNVWQLNYTTNSSDWINISDTNTSRPHMNFPVIDLGDWTEEIMSYFNATAEGNVSLGTIARVMKDNITNPMNLESRAFELKSLDNGQQNDTVYYYSVLLDNFTAFSEESYDEWLHLHIQMTPEDDVETSEYGDFMVGIDVDNNRTWNTNDRVYWAYANSTGLQWNETYDGTGNPKANIAVWNIWESEDNAPGNLHRYTGHLNYAISIPLADLVKSNGEPLNSTDVFGLSIITTTSGTSFVLQDACVWQNWNETTESTYADEENNLTSIMEYFFNYTEELETEGPVPEALHLGRWGEGEIGEGLVASGDVSYAVTIEKSSNISTIAYGSTYALVNYSIWVNNTGSAPLTDVVVNDTRFNCTCHDFNETNFTGTNISWDSVTNYSCYREFNITSIAASGSWHIWYTVNITTCPSVTCGTIQNNASVNATELSTAVTTNNQITWACASAGLSLTETITNLMMFIIVITIITSLLSLVLKKINW